MNFEYTNIIEKNLGKQSKLVGMNKIIISIITPFYNQKKYLEDTAKCIINQTFPYFEWIIVDDGSDDNESLKYLEKIGNMDARIKIIHKENTGQAHSRDYGVEQSSKESKYILFIDDDDIIDDTYLECAYWTLETNDEASWAFTDVVHFDKIQALATTKFDPEREKKENVIVVTALIRKNDFLKVGGFGLKEKGIYEDWNLWLKMIAAGMYPVRMNFFGFWYRRKNILESELAKSKQNERKANQIIESTVKTISNPKPAIQYPKQDYNWDCIEDCVESIVVPKYEINSKVNILMIIPWMVIGGADKFNIDLIDRLDKEKFEVTVITTEPNYNPWREKYQKNTKAIYDLTTFLDRKYWLAFVNYIIEKNNINIIFNTNSTYGYSILPYLKAKNPQIPIIDYIHMEEWYNRNGGFSRDSSSVASVIDKTLVCNENTRKILINHFRRNENEVETVYIGVDENKFCPDGIIDKENLKSKYNIPKDKKIISFIARIDLQKRPILLIEIIKSLNSVRDDFCFVIAGNGPMLDEIKMIAIKNKLQRNIRFLGAVSNTSEIYRISDVTLNCSIKEGLALTAYESLSMGVPVVSANVGGQAELINDEVGVIVPCLQDEKDVSVFEYTKEEINNYIVALNKVLNNLDRYKKNARKRIINGFTLNHMIEKMSQILEYTAKNPNKEKASNAIGLAKSMDICKELNTKYFEAFADEYDWLVHQTNKEKDKQVAHIYKKSTEVNKKIKLKDKIRNEGKRTLLNKVFIKLHIYHEMKIIMDIIEKIYMVIKSVFLYLYNIVKVIIVSGFQILGLTLKLIYVILVRLVNIVLRFLHKKTIDIDENE